MNVRSIFFGYPERPRSVAETLRAIAAGVRSTASVDTVTWEDLQVDGRIVIREVLNAIDSADMCVFDVTSPNPNVLFEAGYAIARGKQVWLSLDSTNAMAKREWKELGILKDIGYTPYRNSGDFISAFSRSDPLNTLEPLYDTLIERSLMDGEVPHDALLYCTTFEPFESSNRLTALIESRQRLGLRVAVADPAESAVLPLGWYVREMSRAAAVIVHFAGESRNRAQLYNNRHAFIAGVAKGLDIEILLLGEEDYRAPFDFESDLRVYETAEECVEEAREWLDRIEFEGISLSRQVSRRENPLSGLRFGEHVAENERLELADYFVETSAFKDVIAARDSIFIGHRGTGKTANAIQAFTRIAANKTNLAVLIKPPGFEFPAMMAVVAELPDFQHDYFFDALWRFVIQTEIAATVHRRLLDRPGTVPFAFDEQSFLDYVSDAPFDLRADVSVRLEQALSSLRSAIADVPQGDRTRNFINEAFHSQSLAILRSQLGKVLKGKKRVAVFVDNLDKGWERGTDFTVMARFIFGLLSARGQVVTDFQKQDYWRDAIKLTVAVFLRSDIYTYLRKEAREPDKLPISSVVWDDWDALKSVIEARFAYSGFASGEPGDLWGGVFCAHVDGEPLEKFLKRVVLPRPRDVVFLCNAATGRALDRAHLTVEEDDFRAARETYSQYAYEALLVENGVTIPEMEEALLSFIGTSAVETWADRCRALEDGGVSPSDHERIITKLITMSFFGVEAVENLFVFPEVGSALSVTMARARRLEGDQARRRLSIHPAFHPFLGILE